MLQFNVECHVMSRDATSVSNPSPSSIPLPLLSMVPASMVPAANTLTHRMLSVKRRRKKIYNKKNGDSFSDKRLVSRLIVENDSSSERIEEETISCWTYHSHKRHATPTSDQGPS